jgi:hypothetical protein
MSLSQIETFKLLFIKFKPGGETDTELEESVSKLKGELEQGTSNLEQIRGEGAYGEAGDGSLADIRQKVDELLLAWPQLESRWGKLDFAQAAGAAEEVGKTIAALKGTVESAKFVPVKDGPTKASDEQGLRGSVKSDIGQLETSHTQACAKIAESGKKRLTDRLKLMAEWAPAAKKEAGTLQKAVDNLGTPLVVATIQKVSGDVDTAFNGWRNVRDHNVQMAMLKKQFATITASPPKIPGKGVTTSPLATEWTALSRIEQGMELVTGGGVRTGSERLPELRGRWVTTASTLVKKYEEGTTPPGNDYWLQLLGDLWDRGGGNAIYQKASCVPILTPEMATLRRELDRTKAIVLNGTAAAKDRVTAARGCLDAAKQLVAARTTADKAEAAFYTAWRKIEPDVLAAEKTVTSSVQPLTTVQTDFNVLYAPFKVKLASTDSDRREYCAGKLDQLRIGADAVLHEATERVKQSAQTAKAMPATNATEKQLKAYAARDLIDATDPAILQRLSVGDQADLLETLQADGVMTTGSRRTSTVKLYKASRIDPGFEQQEATARKAIVNALAKHKDKLKDARDNWSAMTDKQKGEILQLALETQCEALGFAKPVNPMVIGDFATLKDKSGKALNKSDNGHYNPGDDVVRINTGQAVFQDFELSMDLIFHENSHNRQFKLIKELGQEPPPMADPPRTQVRMFKLSWADGNGYVPGKEEYEAYQKQPLELNAWSNGPVTAQAVMDALAR